MADVLNFHQAVKLLQLVGMFQQAVLFLPKIAFVLKKIYLLQLFLLI